MKIKPMTDMDYAFAPGGTSYDRYMRKLFTYKANTANVTASDIHDALGDFISGRAVEDFVLYLISHQSGTPSEFPPDQIFIASHANASGWMEINLDSDQDYSQTTYEAIDSADSNDTISLPPDVVMGGGIFVTSTIQIKGCNVGRATAFLQKLKSAFSTVPFLQAPKHYHYLHWSYANSKGIFEYMQYDLAVITKDRITSRNDLIAAFQGANMNFIDGSAIPDDQWTRWIPSKWYKRKKQFFDHRVPLGQEVAGLTRINAGREYRHVRTRGTFIVPDVNSRPDSANHRNLLRTHLLTIFEFQDAHPFPAHTRLGYSSLDDMLDNLNIRYNWIRNDNELRCQYTRYEYRILLPIRETPDGNLIFNFYPKTGSSHTPVNNMLESDTRLFAIV